MPKIKSLKPLNDGMAPADADKLWADIEGFAAYSFCAGHSVAYSLISYICMYLKVHYPAEFFCGYLTMVKQEKRPQALADMRRLGIKLLPPDINDSSEVFEVLTDTAVLAPLASVKGISDNTARAILHARKDGRFLDKADFEKRVPARACNVRHREVLDKVGAFARIDPTALPATDYTRRRDQMELMQGLIDDPVIIDRPMEFDTFKVNGLQQIIQGMRSCTKCDLKGLCHPKPWVKGKAKMMIILDGPSYKEESFDEMGHGGQADSIEEALEGSGLSKHEVYITSMIKSPKPDKGGWANQTISECPAWLHEEIGLLRPPVIVLLGTLAAKHFIPDLKGAPADQAGRVIYDRKMDCNLVLGFNPASIYFDPGKQTLLDEVIAKSVSLLTI